MKEIVCPGCKFEIPDRLLSRDVKYCPNCGLELEKVELECCGQWILKKDMEFCKVCPFCGRDYKDFLKDKAERQKRQKQKSDAEWERTQEALHPPQLKGVTVKARSTGCKYQGSSKDMLWALCQDQVRNELIIEDVLKELKKHIDNRTVVLSDNSKHLEIIHQSQFLKEKKVEVVLDGSSDKKLSDASGSFESGAILLITSSELMESELRYMNRLFLASVFDLTEPLIKKIGKAQLSKAPNQHPLMIFDYLDQDEEGYFNALYQERVKLYEKHGSVLEKLKG